MPQLFQRYSSIADIRPYLTNQSESWEQGNLEKDSSSGWVRGQALWGERSGFLLVLQLRVSLQTQHTPPPGIPLPPGVPQPSPSVFLVEERTMAAQLLALEPREA